MIRVIQWDATHDVRVRPVGWEPEFIESVQKDYDIILIRLAIRDEAKCINCMICWVYCPDSCINTKDGKMTGFDLDYCKGCGICAKVCPVKCIKMEKEQK